MRKPRSRKLRSTRAWKTPPQPRLVSHLSEGVGLTIDVSKAHKRLRIREGEWDFYCSSIWASSNHYTVCHFGARFSAAWWSRMGAVLIRLCHKFLFVQHLLFPAPSGLSHQLARSCTGTTGNMEWSGHDCFLMFLANPEREKGQSSQHHPQSVSTREEH